MIKNITMTIANLKNEILQRINEVDDVYLLEEIHRILFDNNASDEIYVFSPAQEKELDNIISEMDKGVYVTHQQAEKELDQWLK